MALSGRPSGLYAGLDGDDGGGDAGYARDKPTVTKIHLTTKAKIPGIDKAKFDELADNAKAGCPISRLLAAAEITMDATLV